MAVGRSETAVRDCAAKKGRKVGKMEVVDIVFLVFLGFWFCFGVWLFIGFPIKKRKHSLDYNKKKYIFYLRKKTLAQSEFWKKFYAKKLEKLKAEIKVLLDYEEEWYVKALKEVLQDYEKPDIAKIDEPKIPVAREINPPPKIGKTCAVAELELKEESEKDGTEK